MCAKKEEDKIPDYITKHKKLYGHATKLIDTVSHTHTEAYTTAVTKHLTDKDGEIDYEKLDDNAVQKQFVKTMSDMYIGKAKAHFKISKDLDDLEKEILMEAYAGTTTQQIKGLVGRYGKRFNHDQFERVKGEIQQQVGQKLYAASGSHLDDENVGDIVKHVGLEGKVNKAMITLDEARGLLGAFHRSGSINEDTLRQIIAPYKLAKKEKPA